MCGIFAIAGHTTKSGGDKKTTEMLATLSKRGPDDRGTLIFPGCTLGQTRLSIIDLSGGHQPMKDNKKDNAIIFNGEIFNYQELKLTLESKGHVFSSHSDTEVILKAYAEYGESCVDHLDGQFAFAIWDNANEKLFAARDRFGEKPFYYGIVGNTIVCASEIKALLASGLVTPEIDPVSVDNYLTLLCIPPWRTVYKNIHPLPPAHSFTWHKGTLAEKRYWKLLKNPLTIGMDEASETVKSMLTESVKSRMVADVEVGAFLSGGIDSSIITYLAQSALQTSGSEKKIKAFSAGFEDFINELPYAEEMAKVAGVDHYTKQIMTKLVESFLAVSTYFDEPFADSSNIPTYLISKFAREQVKVALSGDGGDELFYGYGHYRNHWHLQKHKKIFRSIFSDPFLDYKKQFRYFTVSERKLLWKDSAAIENDPLSHVDLGEAETPLEKINLIDMYMTLPADMLVKVDRSSMMNSLEVRSPFLNHKLAEFAYNLSAEIKTTKTQGKVILAKAFGDILPPSLFTRKKQGFNAPIRHWLRRPELRAYIQMTLLENPLIATMMNVEYIRSVVRRFYDGDNTLQQKVWMLLSLETWMRTRKF